MALSLGVGGGCVTTANPAHEPAALSPAACPDSIAADLTAADHFVTRDGMTFAGTHVIIDLWEASRLDDLQYMEEVLRSVISRCKATLLHIHLHHFSPDGISGVAVLAESHISVHTWPERNFAAFDVFMCGAAQPGLAVPILKDAFDASRVEVREIRRGILSRDHHETV